MVYGKLRQEIENDPLAVGYAGMADVEVADALNAESRTRTTFTFTGAEFINAVDPSEWAALTTGEQENMRMLIGAGGVLDASENTTVRSLILSAFGVSSATITNLVAIAEDDISRADELGLPTVYPFHIKKVRS